MGIKIKGSMKKTVGKIIDEDSKVFDVEVIMHDETDGTARVMLLDLEDRPKGWDCYEEKYVLDGTRPLPPRTDFYYRNNGILYNIHKEENEAEDGVWEIEYGHGSMICKTFAKIRNGALLNAYDEPMTLPNVVAVKRIGNL